MNDTSNLLLLIMIAAATRLSFLRKAPQQCLVLDAIAIATVIMFLFGLATIALGYIDSLQ